MTTLSILTLRVLLDAYNTTTILTQVTFRRVSRERERGKGTSRVSRGRERDAKSLEWCVFRFVVLFCGSFAAGVGAEGGVVRIHFILLLFTLARGSYAMCRSVW